MIKLIHAADLHLDSPFSGLSPQQAAQRRREQRELLSRLAELVRARSVDALLLSGDLLDTGRAFRETAELLAHQLGGVDCPVLIAPGNHDFFHCGSPYATIAWPENVSVFTTEQMETVELPEKNICFHGAAFVTSHQDNSPLSGFCAPEDTRIHIGVLHADVNSQSGYGPVLREEIAACGLHYLALGHVHQYSGLQKDGKTFWAYPGCPEGRGFDELGDKGVLYLEIEADQVRAEFIPLCKRRYQICSVDLTGQENVLQAVRAVLPPDTKEDIYRILLTGERSGVLDLVQLQKELEGSFYSLNLRDQTRAARQIWARKDEDTLTGLFLREMFPMCQQEPDNEIFQLAVQFGLAALEGEEDPCP